jgi:hypothetical protein
MSTPSGSRSSPSIQAPAQWVQKSMSIPSTPSSCGIFAQRGHRAMPPAGRPVSSTSPRRSGKCASVRHAVISSGPSIQTP